MKFFKKLTAVILLIGIVANSFSYLVISTAYQFNKSYLTSVFCTNKNKPQLHCEGKCFLDIKLKELEQKNKKAEEHLKRTIETVSPPITSLACATIEFELLHASSYYLIRYPIDKSSSIFHPPQSLSQLLS